jgi:hypothetical protein
MSDLTPKSFRLDRPTCDQLSRLAARLGGSEAQTLRFALAALEGTLDHGLAEWTFEGSDGKRQILLRQPAGLALSLVEDDEGGFTPWHKTNIKPTHTWE